MKYLVFAGSTRKGSLHRELADLAAASIERQGDEATVVDLRDYPMPIYDGDFEAANGLPESVRKLKKLFSGHDALVIASPEYNGSFPALVKNVIDWLTRAEPGERHSLAFRGKPVTLIATSPGPGGGKRGLRHLRELLEMIGARVVHEITIPSARIADAVIEIPKLQTV